MKEPMRTLKHPRKARASAPMGIVIPDGPGGVTHAATAYPKARAVIVRRKGPGHQWAVYDGALWTDNGPCGRVPILGLASFAKFEPVTVGGYTYAFAFVYPIKKDE